MYYKVKNGVYSVTELIQNIADFEKYEVEFEEVNYLKSFGEEEQQPIYFQFREIDIFYSLFQKYYSNSYHISLYCRLKGNIYVHICLWYFKESDTTKYDGWYTNNINDFYDKIAIDSNVTNYMQIFKIFKNDDNYIIAKKRKRKSYKDNNNNKRIKLINNLL